MFKKSKIIFAVFILFLILFGYLYLKYFFTYEQKNITQRKIDSITGQNLTVTIFGLNGNIIKRWTGVKKLTEFQDNRNYTFFYSNDGKYVQIPNSVWYIAEEE